MSQRLSRAQVLMIGSAFVLDATLVSKPSLVIRDLKNDYWVAFLPTLVYGLASVFLIALLASRFPRKDLLDGMVTASPVFGRIVSIGYALFFFGVLVRDIRSSVDFIKVALLEVTPWIVIAAVTGFSLIAVARRGKLSIARMSQLWQPMLIFILLLLPFLVYGALSFEELLPVFRHSPEQVARASLHLTPYVGEAAGIVMIATYRPWIKKYSMLSVMLGWALLLLLTSCVVLGLGTEIPVRTLYPNYELIRKLRLTDFLDRLDLPMIGIWLPAMLVKASFGLYIATNGVTRAMPKLSFAITAAVIGAGATAMALLIFDNAMQIFEFDRYWTPVSFGFQLALPALLLFLFRKRKRRRKETAQPKESKLAKDEAN